MSADGNYISDSDIDNWPSGSTDATKLVVIQLVEDIIEQLTKDYFYPKTFSKVMDGNGKTRIWLHFNPKILSVSEIKLSEVVLTDTFYSFDDDSIFRSNVSSAQTKSVEGVTLSGSSPAQIDLTSHGFVSSMTARLISMVGITPSLDGEYVVTKVSDDAYSLNGTDSSDYSGVFVSGTSVFASLAELHYHTGQPSGFFPKGNMNIEITGTYGWTTCPGMIKQAAIILARFENDETLYTKYDDFVSDKLGDAAVNRGQKQYLTGVLEADRLLKLYIRKKPLIHAV